MNVYVDVDNTLVLWQGKYNDKGEESWVFNFGLVRFVEALTKLKHVHVVVWSSGGESYARTWGNRCFKEDLEITYAAKCPVDLDPAPIFIDDAPWEVWKPFTIDPRVFML